MNPLKIIFNRGFILALFMILQISFLAYIVFAFEGYFVYYFWISLLISFIVVISIMNNRSNFVYKIGWIVPVFVFPLFGSILYLLYGGNKHGKKTKNRMKELMVQKDFILKQNDSTIEKLKNENSIAANQALYIKNYSNSPIYINSRTEFFELGELGFKKMIEEIKKAEKFIFLEYFIIDKGIVWDTILDILIDKVKSGVEVKIIYDDIGCLFTLPHNYYKYLESLGIKCKVFHPLKPLFTLKYNNRDHRKILVIDNKIAFTGGINLADEYINEFEKYGHWKDSVIMTSGKAVHSFTAFFLLMWDYISDENTDYKKYLEEPLYYEIYDNKLQIYRENSGYIQPFSDSPLDGEALSETIYLNLLGSAKKYAYITTPYLILDDTMKSALCAAGKRGVDVRIIVPHIPDKWYVHSVSKSNYEELLESNIRIYEYTPGFIHSKLFISDDEYAVVGTINIDYRSLYLHFECGIWMYKSQSLYNIKKDIEDTISKSKEIKFTDIEKVNIFQRTTRTILKILSPLM
ncbi:MAG: cardiolipin synthase [Andreesenia angusta]|nr:cardiolipin synthase [Andreesenia angusta]